MKILTTTSRLAMAGLLATASASLHAQSSFESLDSLVVTGSSFLEKLSDAPVRTELLSAKLFEKIQTRSFAEAIEYNPGLRVENNCQNCGQQSLQMLGLPQSYVGILFDGLPNFSGLAGVYGIEHIPTGLIDHIEIVKGGGSVLYGAGAVAGVINLIPREASQSGFSISSKIADYKGDSFGKDPSFSTFIMGDFVNKKGTVSLTAFYNYDYLAPVDYNKDGFTDISERELHAAGLHAFWKINKDQKLFIDYLFSHEDRRGGDIGAAFERPENQSFISEAVYSRRHALTLKWNSQWSEKWKTQFAYSYSHTERDSYYGGIVALGTGDATSPFYNPHWTPQLGYGETENDLHFADFLANYQLNDKNRFSFGVQYRYETLTDIQKGINRSIDTDYTDFALIAQHRWTPNDTWTVEYGVRSDWHSELNDPVISPRAAVMYEPRGDLRIRAAVSTGFRAPEVFDEDLHIANVGGDLQRTTNAPNLKEEKSVTVSLSPEWNITDHWRLEVNAFYTWLNDSFSNEPHDDPATANITEYERINAGNSKVYGAEFNLGYFADNWSLEFSWVEQRQSYDSPQLVLEADGAGVDVFSSKYVRTPESVGLLKFSYKHPWFDTFVSVKGTGPMDIPHIVSDGNGGVGANVLHRTDWMLTVDIGLSKKIELNEDYDLTLYAGVKNLFDTFQDDLDKSMFRDPSYVYGPAFSRSFYCGAKLAF